MDTQTAAPTPIDFEKRTEQFILVRDRIAAIEEKHKEELKPWKDLRDKIQDQLLGHLNAVGADNVGTKVGTVYRQMRKSATIADKSAFWTWVVTQGSFDMIDYKANAPKVAEYINQQIEEAKADPTIVPAPPPGINYSVTYVAGVQRK